MGILWGFLKWVVKTISEKLLGDAVSLKSITGFAALLWAAVSAVLMPFLHSRVAVPGWLIAIAGGYFVALTILAAVAVVRSRPRKVARFTHVVVRDAVMAIEWNLKEDPKTWKHLPIPDMTPTMLCHLLDGPYHSAQGCKADVLMLERYEMNGSSTFQAWCMYCSSAEERQTFAVSDVNNFRRATLVEILRMHRLGETFKREVCLERVPWED